MFSEVLYNDYFWLSFLPIALLGGGFWLLYFDRADRFREPLKLLVFALVAGSVSAIVYSWIIGVAHIEHAAGNVLGEELAKMVFAVVTMELLQKRFSSISQGIMYGFAVGLGFAVAENIVYLANSHQLGGFSPMFWIGFQGRFWSSSLLHGVTTGTLGLFYAGAYLAKTVYKKEKESPLRVFFVPPNVYQLGQILTLHVSRRHLLLSHEKTLKGHYARAVILEGLWLAFLVHLLFNMFLEVHLGLSLVLSFGGMVLLKNRSQALS